MKKTTATKSQTRQVLQCSFLFFGCSLLESICDTSLVEQMVVWGASFVEGISCMFLNMAGSMQYQNLTLPNND